MVKKEQTNKAFCAKLASIEPLTGERGYMNLLGMLQMAM